MIDRFVIYMKEIFISYLDFKYIFVIKSFINVEKNNLKFVLVVFNFMLYYLI